MKKMILMVLIVVILFSSCNYSAEVEGVVYPSLGLLNTDMEVDTLLYRVDAMNMIWAFIFFETVIVPVVVFGWCFCTPIGYKNTPMEVE